MGHASLAYPPLTPPHRRRLAGADQYSFLDEDNPATEVEAMTWPFDKKKSQLLPKDLAGRAEKVPAEKVEAEVLRIVKGAPASPTPLEIRTPAFPMPGAIIPVPNVRALYQQELQGLQQAQQQAQRQGMLRGSILGNF